MDWINIIICQIFKYQKRLIFVEKYYSKNNREDGKSFIQLASNLNGNEFQSFMMGESNLLTKLKIINSMPKLPFIKELFK